jgi:hypothetical protein
MQCGHGHRDAPNPRPLSHAHGLVLEALNLHSQRRV